MTAITVTTSPQLLAASWSDLQNLGSADIYVDADPGVSSSSGVKVEPGQCYSRPMYPDSGRGMYVVAATGSQDVRVIK